MPRYDFIVIGSGPAGEKAAAHASYLGKRAAIVEAEASVGGAAVNTGTLPSKTLRESALFLSGFRQRGLYGVNYTIEGELTVGRFLYRVERLIERERTLTARSIERHGVDVIWGWGSFIDAHTLRVDKPRGGSMTLTADVFLIATGSRPFRPPDVPFHDLCLYDSDTILRLDKVPSSLTVVGAGVIGCEYACIFAALGVEVVLIDSQARILPFLDEEICALLMRRMRRLGVQFMLQERVAAYEIFGDGPKVRARLVSGQIVESDDVLFASGRSGNTDRLGLENVGIPTNSRGAIQVDANFQTVVPHIYAAGDVIGFPALASTSMEQGRLAAAHAFAPEIHATMAQVLPYGLYTIPEVSMVGETEQALREKGIPYQLGRETFAHNTRGQISGETEGMIKLLFSPSDRKVLGVHIIGENATELVHVGTTCMYFGGGLDCFTESVFNYPTLSEAYKYAAYDGLARLVKSQKKAASEAAAVGDPGGNGRPTSLVGIPGGDHLASHNP